MARVLVLNASYEPLSVVSTRRAVVLVLGKKADMVAPGDDVMRSEHVSVSVPSVIRLRTFVRVPYARRVPLNRRAVFYRDDGQCQYCSHTAENLDHVVPRAQGGTHVWENVVAACRRCNTKKGGRTPEQAGMHLQRMPQAPRRHSWILIGLGASPHPSWEPFLATG